VILAGNYKTNPICSITSTPPAHAPAGRLFARDQRKVGSSVSRQQVFYQSIIFTDEWIDKRDILQHESILKILGQNMPDSSTLSRGP
jgi:hypothetical protein